jgi:hypothetical protein
MHSRKFKYEGAQIGLTINDFTENSAIIKQRLVSPMTISEDFERALFDPKYHGNNKPGCCLVKKRRELVHQSKNSHPHYLDIFVCLNCGVECLRSGWQIHWYGGTYSPGLK